MKLHLVHFNQILVKELSVCADIHSDYGSTQTRVLIALISF